MICVLTVISILVFVASYNFTNLPVIIQVISSSRSDVGHFTHALLNCRYE